jgi:SAM-dependent methyltransferase
MTNNLKEISKSYIDWAPVSLAVRELSRMNALKILNLETKIFSCEKVLDVGCGDGKWWTHLCPGQLYKIHGVDISQKEILIAKKFIHANCLDITAQDFMQNLNERDFDLVIGNCSLEHVYHLDKALKNILDSLRPGGTFILFVPTPYWALKGKTIAFLNGISPRLSMAFSGFLNGFFQHWHLYNHNIWKSILTNFGFIDLKLYGIGNKKSEFLFRLGLPTAFLSFLVKCMTGKYINYFISSLVPNHFKDFISNLIVSGIETELQDIKKEDIFEYMIVCKK